MPAVDPLDPTAGIVLVHGACSDSRCWAPTIAALAARAPDVPFVAVDLPGRGRSRVPLRDATLTTCIDETVRQIDEAGLDDVILVGHSLAGAILPGAATRLGSDRVQRLVFLTCAVPPEGGSVVDVLRGPLRAIAAVAARRRSPTRLPAFVALAAFANGMTPQQPRIVAGALCPEAGWLIVEPVTRENFDETIPRTWILTRKDRGLSRAQQQRSIGNLGGVEECIELDAPHDAMVSHPDQLAEILLTAARRSAPAGVE
jgi:pimeloyl-ACP methyl ester carboxylesterase